MLPAESVLSADRYFSKAEEVISFGVKEIDQELFKGPNGDGLISGALHEWFYDPGKGYPPHTILTYLAAQSLKDSFLKLSPADQSLAQSGKFKRFRFALWVGKESWPSAYVLREATLVPGIREISLLSHCLFTNPPDQKLKLWSVISALRSKCVSCVVVELNNLKLADTKRLSLAAEKSKATVFLIRNIKERTSISSAATRWFVSASRNSDQNPKFELTLLSSKGRRSLENSWNVEFILKGGENVSLRKETVTSLSLAISSKLGRRDSSNQIRQCQRRG